MKLNQVLELLEARGISISQSIVEVCLREGTHDFLAASFSAVRADEGTLWLLDEAQRMLVPVWNSGTTGSRFVGRHCQPLDSGLISLVCVSEQGLCENSVYENRNQDRTLDGYLEKVTCAMIAVPLRFHGATQGVVSCVRLKSSLSLPDPESFSSRDLSIIEEALHRLQHHIDSPSQGSLDLTIEGGDWIEPLDFS